uniref:Uncharacterized protein n=1 Tax=Fagus sylvatica TaxID=28930 RepID=A0A2N9GH92_FAGSY
MAPPPNPPLFSGAYRFLTRFSGQLLEAFWCSKWVMQHIIRKVAESTFQRYNFYTNRSSDGKVMVPGSRGVGAVFSHFSDEDSGQTGEATGEPRVASCSWSCSLSNAPGLMDQIAASQKESAREGSCPRGKTRQIFSAFRLDWGKSWRYESCTPCLYMSSFLRTQACGSNPFETERIFARARHSPGGGYEIFSIVLFLPSIFAHMVVVAPNVGFQRSWCHRKACITFFLKVLGSHRGELGFARCDPANRGRWNVSHAGGSSFDPDSGLTGGALDNPRVAHCGQPNPAFGPINASVKSQSNLIKLGQPWSNLANLTKLQEMCSGPHFEVLLMRWASVGSNRLASGCFILRADTRENPGILDLEIGGMVARDEDSEDFWSAWRRVHCPMVIGKHGFFQSLVSL